MNCNVSIMNRDPIPRSLTHPAASNPTAIYLTACSLLVLLVNEFFSYSKYVKPVTKTLASLGFLYAGLCYGLVNSDQGSYVFIGE